jgi:hypothetical protein
VRGKLYRKEIGMFGCYLERSEVAPIIETGV